MPDAEKVINGLECCTQPGIECYTACPYVKVKRNVRMTCCDVLMGDALALLKAQEPRVMTPADVNNIGPEDVCAFIEIRGETHMYACYMHQYDETHTEIMCNVPDMPTKLQNGCARLWTSRPTDEQRAETPWEGR